MKEKILDWNVEITPALEIVLVRPLSIDSSRIRLVPVYDGMRHLSVVIPAMNAEEARTKGVAMAKHILASGIWGLEVWNLPSFLASIEQLI